MDARHRACRCTQRCLSSLPSIFNCLSTHGEIRYVPTSNVGKCGVRNPLYWGVGAHISLDPVSKADGILAKIFIYNILQQRLDRLLLAVLRRKRGRRVHEWGCRSGSGSAGRSAGVGEWGGWGPGKQEITLKTQEVRTPPTAHKLKLRPATRWEKAGFVKKIDTLIKKNPQKTPTHFKIRKMWARELLLMRCHSAIAVQARTIVFPS